MTADEVLQRMSSEEISGWKAIFEVDDDEAEAARKKLENK